MKTSRRWIEFFRAFLWTPTEKIRERTLYCVRAGSKAVCLKEAQRLHFGRWGRWKWKTERRWVTIDPKS